MNFTVLYPGLYGKKGIDNSLLVIYRFLKTMLLFTKAMEVDVYCLSIKHQGEQQSLKYLVVIVTVG